MKTKATCSKYDGILMWLCLISLFAYSSFKFKIELIGYEEKSNTFTQSNTEQLDKSWSH